MNHFHGKWITGLVDREKKMATGSLECIAEKKMAAGLPKIVTFGRKIKMNARSEGRSRTTNSIFSLMVCTSDNRYELVPASGINDFNSDDRYEIVTAR